MGVYGKKYKCVNFKYSNFTQGMKKEINRKGFLPRNFERKYRIKELIYKYADDERMEVLEQLADAMQIDVSSVRRIWNYRPTDTAEAKPSQLRAAARFFNIPLEEIFSDHEEVVEAVV